VNDQTLRELGAYLCWKRKEKGKTLEEVSAETRLRVEILRAIEKGEIQALPAPVYARGMIRLYLEYLRSSELLPQYEEFLRTQVRAEPSEASFAKPTVTKGFRRRDNRWAVALLALAVLLAGYLLWQQKGVLGKAIERKAEQATVAAQFQTPPATPGSLDHPSVPVEKSSSPGATAGDEPQSDDLSWLPGHGTGTDTPGTTEPGRLEITALESCWILVTREGETLFRGTLKKGESRIFPSEKEIRVRYGKPTGVAVRWMGKDLGKPSTQQKVVTVLYKPDGSFAVR
jgi:cytoskeletal protein RodZ